MTEKLKSHDPDWMVWRVLRQDVVTTDAQPENIDPYYKDQVARTWGNVLTALFRGYQGTYRVYPDETVRVTYDYTHLDKDGSYGMNVPPWVEERKGTSGSYWEDRPRYGHVDRP